ncbi:hypothetical protein [Thermococcus sp.]|uniref:hypothetical protein n=1 Tax=Thermococcus sp. TaxID=35749 RepID=UPI002625249A|nr:hypothetical protein [Thermococcus sp.]
MPGIGIEGPEELEERAIRSLNEGSVKEGLKLMLRAAKGYEGRGEKADAARLYKYLGYILLEKTGDVSKARPSLLKGAYLYLDLIDRELSRPEVDLDSLDDYCFNVLEVFARLGDEKNLREYAEEFAAIYEDLGNSYKDNNDVEMAIRAYESAYRYYRIIDDADSYRRVSEALITLYGQVAEAKLERGDVLGAARAFYRLAYFILAIFGYDIHFMEMMDTAAKNFEKASKLAYSNGDLDGTTGALVQAQYAYLLAKNFNRAKLIGLNTARMLHQVVSAYRSQGDDEKTALKLLELAEALVGIGKTSEGLEAYKSALEYKSNLKMRTRIRLAFLKKHAAENGSKEVLSDVETMEYYLGKGRDAKALELAEKAMERENLRDILEKIHEAEGVY